MKRHISFVLGLLFLGLSTQSVFAEDAGAAPEELPIVSGRGVLTIAGEGYWHRQKFENGEQPTLSAYDAAGQLLADGVYRYEFRAVEANAASNSRQREMLKNPGQAGRQVKGKSQAANMVTGSFEIQGGQLLNQ